MSIVASTARDSRRSGPGCPDTLTEPGWCPGPYDAEGWLRHFVDEAPSAIAMFDTTMRHLAVSRRWAEDVRVASPDELIGRNHYEMFPGISEEWRSVHRRVLAGERVSSDMEAFRQADGDVDWVRWNMVPWRRDDGTIGGALLFSERMPDPGAERKALEDAHERLRLATEAGRIGIWEYDVERRALGWDARMYALYGTEPREDVQTYDLWRRHLHPEDRARAERDITEALVRGSHFAAEFRILRSDGALRHLCAAGQVSLDAAGRPTRLLGTCWDITEQKRFEEERLEHELLERSADEFRTLAEGMADICWMAEPDGRMCWLNQRFYDYTGTLPAEMEGWGWLSTVDPDSVPLVRERCRTAIAAGKPFELTFPLRRADGAFRPFLTRIVPVLGPDGHLQRWLGTNVDVYEVQQINVELERRTEKLARLTQELSAERDKAEQANLAKSRFLAGMSHELRTPLNGILGYAHILKREGGLSAAQTARVECMLAAGSHLLDTINSVLTLSEIEAEKMALHVSSVDPVEIAAECCNMMRAVADAKHLLLGHVAKPDTPSRVTTDPKRLRQILLNLLGNAVKFTKTGEIRLRLSGGGAGDCLRIEVADTGPGVPGELRHRLFGDFERAACAQNGAIEGSGLGLALSARLTAMIGGRIGHENNPGGGSIFWMEVPLGAQDSPAAPMLSALEMDRHDTRPLRILVADDVAMNCDIAKAFLAGASHDITCVESGAAAIAALSAEPFDVVLMDVRMPGMDGLEATRRIRSLAGAAGRVPIIGLTAQAFAEQVADCRKAGMDAHLAKPFSPDALLDAVAKAVRARSEMVDVAGGVEAGRA